MVKSVKSLEQGFVGPRNGALWTPPFLFWPQFSTNIVKHGFFFLVFKHTTHDTRVDNHRKTLVLQAVIWKEVIVAACWNVAMLWSVLTISDLYGILHWPEYIFQVKESIQNMHFCTSGCEIWFWLPDWV